MKRDTLVLFVIVAVLAGLMIVRGAGRTAEVPSVFSDDLTLDQARAVSAESGRPVLAVATADWCGPCQALKRGALSDPDVAAYLRANTVPVYLEEGPDLAAIRSLGVRAYPTTLLIDGDTVLGMIEGNADAGTYLEMIRRSVPSAGG